MKKLIAYITSICFGLFLIGGTVRAQSGSEIKFNLKEPPVSTNGNLVTVSTVINARQSVSDDGIHFSLIVQNNSGKAIVIKNIAEILAVGLYNESGVNIAIPNDLFKINAPWKFRSKTVIPDKIFINGREDSNDIRQMEHIEIPAFGNCKVNLILRNVKQVEIPEDERNKDPQPTINLAPGKYKLEMSLLIFSKDRSDPGKIHASFDSPKIDIDYVR